VAEVRRKGALAGRRRLIGLAVAAVATLTGVLVIRQTPAAAGVAAAPPLHANGWTTGAKAPVTAAAGTTVTLAVGAVSDDDQTAVLDVELTTPTTQVAQAYWEEQDFAAGTPRQFNVRWNIPADQSPGPVVVKIGIFSAGWSGLLQWNNAATTFTVVPQGTPTTVAPTTAAPTTQPPATTQPPTVPTITARPTTTSSSTSTTLRPTTTSSTSAPTTAQTTTTTRSTTAPSNSGAAACGIADAAFCETFDSAQNGGTQTGDLDPRLWGVSRVADMNPPGILNGLVPSHNLCAGGGVNADGIAVGAATPAPDDVQICNGQLLESVNDGGSVANLNIYPKQPFNFEGRTGTVAFDVSANSSGTHGAWPEFAITDEPVPGVRRSISFGTPAHAQNSVGFTLDGGCLGQPDSTGVGVVFFTVDGDYQEIQGARPNCITQGSQAAMNHIEVRVSTTHIEVWGTDAGSTKLKQLSVDDIPGGLAFAQGLVWMDDVHYNARKAIEPCECGTQYDHTFAWDNLGFDGPKTYRDLGFDVPYANQPGGTSAHGDSEINLGYLVGTGPRSLAVTDVHWDQTPKAAKVVFNAYNFDAPWTSVSVNGHTPVRLDWRSTDASWAWRSMSIAVPISDVVAGRNTLTFASGSASTTVSNVSLILVAAAPVP
jgi:hypothetical protein